MKDDIDTLNRSLVGVRGDRVVIGRFRAELSKAEALNLAAWLVALAEDEDHAFGPVLEAVRNT